jgi:hypothetical protein
MRSILALSALIATASAIALPAWSHNGVAHLLVNTADLIVSVTPGYDLIYGTAYASKVTGASPSSTHTEEMKFEIYSVVYLYCTINFPQYYQVDIKHKFYPFYFAPIDLFITNNRPVDVIIDDYQNSVALTAGEVLPSVTITAKNAYRLAVLQTKVYEQADQLTHSVLKNLEGTNTNWAPQMSELKRSSINFWTDPTWKFDLFKYAQTQAWIGTQTWYAGQTYFTYTI